MERMNMDNPLISVIVPIYMIDRYAGLCVESILNQTYRNLEILLVDDGGRDRCPEICDLYAAKDKRINVIHKANAGLVSARKAGLRESNGEYIAYVDGDDWIGPGFIEGLYTAAKTSAADMVCAGFTRDLFSKSAAFTNVFPSGIYEGRRLTELWKAVISASPRYRPGISTYVWNKLFRREILLDTQSMVDNRISIGEDGAVTYPALLKSKTVAVIDNVAYHYRQREDSMLKQSTDYLAEAQKLLYLYEYMRKWAKTTEPEWNILSQVQDYVLSMAMIRSGGRLPQEGCSMFHADYYGKNVVIYSAGTFGQQLVNRLKETEYCRIVAWLDDDYWEYRRCCLDVEPVESVASLSYDYILIATVDGSVAKSVTGRLQDLGASKEKILTITVPENKEDLLRRFLDIEAIQREDAQRKRVVISHA